VVNFGVAWQDLTRTVGKAVGKPADAEKLVTDAEARLSQVQRDNPDFKGATALFATNYEGIFVYGAEDVRGRLLKSLGFTLPDGLSAVTGTEFGANLSRERTDLLDTDVLVWLVDNYAKAKATIQSEPLYAALAVKKEGRDVFIEDGEVLGSAASFITVLSLPFLLERLVPQLKQAIDGDPATAVTRAS
jgi:iron complex transport system substrate-binding protein